MAKEQQELDLSREGIEMVLPQDLSAARGTDAVSSADSWDPYDVWLTRVKQPRDRLPQRATLVAEVRRDTTVTDSKSSEPLRLRAVT
jgi:hypothetical protein